MTATGAARFDLSPADEALLDRIGDEVFAAPHAPQPSPNRKPRTVDPVVGPSRSTPHREKDLLGPTGTTRSNYSVQLGSLLGPDDLRGEKLRRLDRDPDFVEQAIRLFGITTALGEPFRCILPGHPDEPDTAVLWVSVATGDVLYRDVHPLSEHSTFTLTEVHAALLSGRLRRRSGPDHAVFKLDLLRALGLITPVPVELPALPPGASKAAETLRRRFADLVGLRRLRDDGDDAAPYSKRFAADWCGLPETTTLRAIGELIEAKVIVRVGSHASRHGRGPMSVYLPGEAFPDRGMS